MKVSKCTKCSFCKKRKWSSYHDPANYHPIGMSHIYAYCDKYKERCLDVKNCEEANNG